MGWHVSSFDSIESVDSQWVILYMYDPCTLYMNNVGWGRLVERQTIIEENIFLGAAEYNFTFVPRLTRFHWSNNAHVKI